MSDHLDVQKSLHKGRLGAKKPSSSQHLEDFTPPDGGWGWVVCFTSMLTNGTVFGVINTFGIIYVVMLDSFGSEDENISLKTSFVGSVCTGVTFLMCIVSSILSDRVGIRPVAVTGAVLGTVGLVSSAFVTQLELLYLTYGVLLGIGAAFTYSPSLVILGHYFQRHMGLVNGFVAFGSAIFTIALSLGLPKLLEILSIKYTFLVLGGFYFILIICTLTWKPLFEKEKNLVAMTLSTESVYEHCADCCSFARKFLNVRIFRNRSYVLWCVSLCIALFGYFVPFVHLVKHTKDVFPESDGNLLITFLQITSGVGRLVFGKVADLPFINRITLQQVSFLVMGIVIVCIPFSASYGGLVAISLIFGVTDGVFVCLLGPIAFDIVGPREASQAIGFLLGFFALPFVAGPPIAGLLYDTMHSYDVAFYCAGATPILGALLMFLIPKRKSTDPVPGVTEVEHFASISMLDLHSQHLYNKSTHEKSNGQVLSGPSRTELQVVTFDDLLKNEGGQNGKVNLEDDDPTTPNCDTKTFPGEDAKLLSFTLTHQTDDEKLLHNNKKEDMINGNFIRNDSVVSNQSSVYDNDNNTADNCEIDVNSLLKEVDACLNEQSSSLIEKDRTSPVSEV